LTATSDWLILGQAIFAFRFHCDYLLKALHKGDDYGVQNHGLALPVKLSHFL
jgi:hypothetical protein